MTTVFITGSGTGIGKTLVTAALTHQLNQLGRRVQPLKPVLSGYPPEDGEPSDCEVLLRAADRSPDSQALDGISPWRFKAPLSPDMAARREHTQLELPALVDFCRRRAEETDWLLIEGVGGVLVPLNGSDTVLDWITALAVPVVLVGGSYLGALSHTLTALTTLEQNRVRVLSVVVSESEARDVDLRETCSTLRRFAGPPVLPVPRVSGPEPWRNVPPMLDAIEPGYSP